MSSKSTRRDILIGVSATAGTLAMAGKNSLAASPMTHDVKISSFRFKPRHLVVKVGDIIRWTNEDIAPHTATATEASWDTGEIVKGGNGSIRVTEGLETTYFCVFHPHMKGTIELA
ncbi:plastocyanin/azurin family copper-binding protein [Roseibium sp.]|uniref:plastocyanin/azurin family copper-binding protein n=1 Tax=Roseibium sp. TaxID=1936156 RepID=UPI003D0A8D75